MPTAKPAADSPCPCGLPASLQNGCGRYHAGAPAPGAEALMRSRYSAYVLQLGDYLRATWHPATRPAVIDFDPATRWLGLEIKLNLQQISGRATLAAGEAARSAAPAAGQATPHATPHATPQVTPQFAPHPSRQAIIEAAEALDTVRFVARYKIGGRAYRLEETSRFVRQDGRWTYLDGEIE
jgi:SEC-C motif domain protein